MTRTYQRHHTVVAGVDLYFGLEAIGVTTHNAEIYNHFIAKFHELEREWVAELEEYAVINEICTWARLFVIMRLEGGGECSLSEMCDEP